MLAVAAAPTVASAHNPDTSYARFTIARDHVASRFTYDMTTISRITPTLDVDRDRIVTREEFLAVAPAVADYLRTTIAFEIDLAPTDLGVLQPVAWPPDAGDAIAEKDYHAPESLVSFEFVHPTKRPPTSVWVQFRFFDDLTLRHTVLGAFVHEGAVEEVPFAAPNETDYFFATTYEPPPTSPPAATATGTAPADAVASQSSHSAEHARSRESLGPWNRFQFYFRYGVEHIFIGFDHILFLLSLIIVSRVRELVKIVTAFTVAHSITLAVATLGWIEIPSNVVETAIAATIIFTAVENFWIRDTSRRWRLTFFFGLVHGFGFAGVLRELELPSDGFVRSLLAFNLGVEAGQLAIVLLLALPAALLRRGPRGRIAQRVASGVIALCGLGWFLDRALNLDLMPF